MIKIKNDSRYFNQRNCSLATGFTLIELLIAVLVLAIGLLGLAAMQAQGLKSNNSAEKRTEATFLAMDIIERMRATQELNDDPNKPPKIDDVFNDFDAGSISSCVAGEPCRIAQQDLRDWTTAVKAQLGGGGDAWRARVKKVSGSEVYIVTLMWDDEHTGADGTDCTGAEDDMTCFQTLFQP